VGEFAPSDGMVALAKSGDQTAWACLYRASYSRLVAFAYHRLGNEHEAKDAVSETMARAVAGIGRFDRDDAAFTPWLVGICRNVVADNQRRKYRVRAEQLDDYATDDAAPSDAVLADEERRQVRAAFARLDANERELLELRVVAGLTSEEAAEILGKKPGAIRMAQMRALGRLRTFMEEASCGS
jgi:RNA polymerase sigma-70 factor (ECF subfamily)